VYNACVKANQDPEGDNGLKGLREQVMSRSEITLDNRAANVHMGPLSVSTTADSQGRAVSMVSRDYLR
jgi:hypothetical protein